MALGNAGPKLGIAGKRERRTRRLTRRWVRYPLAPSPEHPRSARFRPRSAFRSHSRLAGHPGRAAAHFAIISHPDAGKTTLTEKLLLFGGAIHVAGAVKARGEARRARSDWMKIEQQRGISVTTSVMHAASVRSGEAQGKHRCFAAGVGKAHGLGRRNHPAEALGGFDFGRCCGGEVRAFGDGLRHYLDDLRMRVALNERAE